MDLNYLLDDLSTVTAKRSHANDSLAMLSSECLRRGAMEVLAGATADEIAHLIGAPRRMLDDEVATSWPAQSDRLALDAAVVERGRLLTEVQRWRSTQSTIVFRLIAPWSGLAPFDARLRAATGLDRAGLALLLATGLHLDEIWAVGDGTAALAEAVDDIGGVACVNHEGGSRSLFARLDHRRITEDAAQRLHEAIDAAATASVAGWSSLLRCP